MCPDPQVLSAYFDGELGDRWASEIRRHLETCNDCAGQVEAFSSLRSSLTNLPAPDLEISKDRSLNQIRLRHTYGPRPSLWTRTVKLPIPVVAAAAALMIVLSVGLVISLLDSPSSFPPSSVSEAHLAGVELEALENMIRYLDSRGAGFQMTFTLPASPQIHITGEPTLMRATEYRGKD